MKEANLTALFFGQRQEPVIIQLENTLQAKQKLVEGLIEFVSLSWYSGIDVDLVINEEGKFMFDANRVLSTTDYIAGPFIVLGPPDEDGNSTSLTPALIQEVTEFFENKLIASVF
jgi:hypothetical protein